VLSLGQDPLRPKPQEDQQQQTDRDPLQCIDQSGMPYVGEKFIRWLNAAMIVRSAVFNCGLLT
jgi:hypothetical protein